MSSKPRRRVRRSEEAQVMEDVSNQRRLLVVAWVIAGVALAALVAIVFSNFMASADADTALNFQFGGLPRVKEDLPRNFRLWTVYPDGNIRFQTAFYPAPVEISTVQTLIVAGPLVNSPSDILSTSYFGASSVDASLQPGPDADSSRVFEAFSLSRATEGTSYGINVLIANPPYIAVSRIDPGSTETEANLRELAMGAGQQALDADGNPFYKQMVWGLALPKGTLVKSAAYALSSDEPASILRPYRRVEMDNWLIYYFDVTNLTRSVTIRIRYQPVLESVSVADPDFWKADRMR